MSISPSEIEFLAEEEIVKVTPRFSLERCEMISGDFGNKIQKDSYRVIYLHFYQLSISCFSFHNAEAITSFSSKVFSINLFFIVK